MTKGGSFQPSAGLRSPYTKGNFEFERVLSGWRAIRPELDMRRKR